MKISKPAAIALFREEAEKAAVGPIDPQWEEKIVEFSRLTTEGLSKTHIAFLGTALIAKAMHVDVDLFAIKPNHAVGNENAYSARTLCHSVLVPMAAELGVNIGVTGREPLNNQPYFRMTRLDDGTPVHSGGRAAFEYMLELIRGLDKIRANAKARGALRAFIAVRGRFQTRYAIGDGTAVTSPAELVKAIRTIVQENSEGGRRAQAIVAGLFDVFAGTARVESGRINDPSRKYPGDVCVRSTIDQDSWEKAVEVRDKVVSGSDIQIFGRKCIDMGVPEAALVMVSDRQPSLDVPGLSKWAQDLGLGLTLFQGWDQFVEQVLFWSELSKPLAAIRAVSNIRARLISVEASPAAVERWAELTGTQSA